MRRESGFAFIAQKGGCLSVGISAPSVGRKFGARCPDSRPFGSALRQAIGLYVYVAASLSMW